MIGLGPSFHNIVDGVKRLPKVVHDFHERQRMAHCGLHAIHNLFRDASITVEDMNKAAQDVANESGDIVLNHKNRMGFWSMETIIRCLQNHQYNVVQGVKTFDEDGHVTRKWSAGNTMYGLLNDDNAYGFIVHEKLHYTAYRKNLSKTGYEYSNSYYTTAQELSPYDFCKKALDGTWNIFLVTRKSPLTF